MGTFPSALLKIPGIQRMARASANWIDLQWSILDQQLKRCAPRARGRLLDVGCGEKPYESIFRPYISDYIGIEYEGTFSATKASSQAGKPDMYYDGVTLPFESSSFDTVISIQVLEHTPNPQRLLNEIGRVVSKDGLVILCAPFSFRLHEEPHDYFRYTPHGLKSMFETAGLSIEEVWHQGDIWSVLGHKLNSYLAFRMARIDAVAQQVGKLGHESTRTARPRYWTLPFVVPAMGTISAAARVFDNLAPDGTETLSYLVFGRPITKGRRRGSTSPNVGVSA